MMLASLFCFYFHFFFFVNFVWYLRCLAFLEQLAFPGILHSLWPCHLHLISPTGQRVLVHDSILCIPFGRWISGSGTLGLGDVLSLLVHCGHCGVGFIEICTCSTFFIILYIFFCSFCGSCLLKDKSLCGCPKVTDNHHLVGWRRRDVTGYWSAFVCDCSESWSLIISDPFEASYTPKKKKKLNIYVDITIKTRNIPSTQGIVLKLSYKKARRIYFLSQK